MHTTNNLRSLGLIFDRKGTGKRDELNKDDDDDDDDDNELQDEAKKQGADDCPNLRQILTNLLIFTVLPPSVENWLLTSPTP